jgi:hypothetical protein
MSFVKRTKYPVDPAILVHPTLNEAIRNVSCGNDKIQFDAEGRKTVKAGRFLAAALDGSARILPRETVATLTDTGSPNIVVGDPTVFAIGDVIKVVEPWSALTLSGTVAASDTVTVTVGGYSVVSTAVTTSLTDLAVLVAANLNSDPAVGQMVTAIAVGAVVHVFGENGLTVYGTSVAETGAGLTASFSSAALVDGPTLGTVGSIVAATNTIVLTGNAAAAVPVGTHIGVDVSEIYGLLPESYDLTDRASINFACYVTASGVRENFLPYIDGDIKRRFPKMVFATKF